MCSDYSPVSRADRLLAFFSIRNGRQLLEAVFGGGWQPLRCARNAVARRSCQDAAWNFVAIKLLFYNNQ
ncbi:MAG: hypothetical protein JSR49_12355 [Proteobacteria bacterium]|nr:hypothetical protein [Pseudomonadota bacterium]